jgi:glycerol kinase
LIGWLRDGLGMIEHARDIEPLARSVADSGGVMLVPALTGLGAPHWDPFARGLVIGLSRATGRGHIARAALESIALSVADVVACMQQDAGVSLGRLRVDGGASGNDLLMQMQADVLGLPVERPAVLETTSLGAAVLAGLSTGFFSDHAAVEEACRVERTFEPRLADADRTRLLTRWREAVKRSRDWARQA